MVRRALAGLLGAALGLLPLALVDIAANNPALMGELAPTSDQLLQLGATALVGGLLLGGGVAGWIAGRKDGVGASAVAGVMAAALYAGVLIGAILLGNSHQQQGLPYVQAHPIRSSAAVLLIALAMIAFALIAGRVVRPATVVVPVAGPVGPSFSRPINPRYPPQRSQPPNPNAWPQAPSAPRERVSVPRSRQSQSGPRYPR